jgi:hypothetical protein
MDYFTNQIGDEFKNLEWDQVYSFVEFVLQEVNGDRRVNTIREINKIFHDEGVPYKIVNGQVTQLISEEEVHEISKAQEISLHVNKAVELFNKRPNPDYANSIKESISAVESIVKKVTGKDNGTLNSVISKLNLHPKLNSGIKNLYDWTSDEGGIRHGSKEGDKTPDAKDARLMLVLCSGFVNYIDARDTTEG